MSGSCPFSTLEQGRPVARAHGVYNRYKSTTATTPRDSFGVDVQINFAFSRDALVRVDVQIQSEHFAEV
jgi:hypothetical protein